MSALLAVFNRTGQPVDPALFHSMLDETAYRAINGQHCWISGSIALARQHFWISRYDRGESQPLKTADGRYAITCMARLDNRSHLYERLGLDAAIENISDARLILEAYRCWHDKCVDFLEGDFQIVVWDAVEQSLFVARDPLGAHGAYYYVDDRTYIVASEIAPILAHPFVTAAINELKVASFLSKQWDDHKQSFYQHIYYCKPGHCVSITASSCTERRYWAFDWQRDIRYRTDHEYAEHFLALLRQSVRNRLTACGPVGLSLSGGLDSTLIGALTAEELGRTHPEQRTLPSWSWVFDDLVECDERPWIQPFVDRYGIQADYFPADELWPLSRMEDWPVHPDFASEDSYFWLRKEVIDRCRRGGCRTLMTGYFADVLFVGSQTWFVDLVQQRRLLTAAKTLGSDWRALNITQHIVQPGLRALVPERFRSVYRRLRGDRNLDWGQAIDSDLVMRTGLVDHVKRQIPRDAYRRPGCWTRYRAVTEARQDQGRLAGIRPYHASHIHVISPFWDRRLIEFMLAIPSDQLGRPGNPKWILRNAAKGILPVEIVDKKRKSSLYPLFIRGIYDRSRSTVERLLADAQIVERGYVNPKWLAQTKANKDAHPGDQYLLWICIVLELWLRKHW